MELFIVIAIVSAALFFSVRKFVKIYKGEKSCDCGSGCSCASQGTCHQDPQGGNTPFKIISTK